MYACLTRRAALSALSALTLAACDTAELPFDSSPRTVLTERIPDVDFSFYDGVDGTAAQEIVLTDHFAVSVPADTAVAYSYEVQTEGAAATVTLDGTLLRVHPVEVGQTTVTVRAQAGGGLWADDTFVVAVRAECPPGPRPGEADFVPLVEGATWRFAFERWNRSGSLETRESGTFTVTLGAMTCARGMRRFTTTEHWEGQRIENSGQPTPILMDLTGSLVETDGHVVAPGSSVATRRYYPSNLSTVTERSASGLAGVTLERGRGVVSAGESGVPHTSSGSSFSLSRLP